MSPNEPQMSVFGTFPEWYYRDILLLGPYEPSHNIGGGVPPTLDQVLPLNSSWKMIEVRNHHFEPVFEPRKKVYLLRHLKIDHVPVMIST